MGGETGRDLGGGEDRKSTGRAVLGWGGVHQAEPLLAIEMLAREKGGSVPGKTVKQWRGETSSPEGRPGGRLGLVDGRARGWGLGGARAYHVCQLVHKSFTY